MSILDSFYPEEELIKPKMMVTETKDFPKTTIVCFSKKIITALEGLCELTLADTLHACYDVPVYTFTWGTQKLAIYMTSIGGPVSAGLMEEIIAKGSGKVLFFGSCGVLDDALDAGRFIIPTRAYRGEGTSYYYMPASDYIEISTSKALCDVFDTLGFSYKAGGVWTTDAIYRETRSAVDARRAEGCIAVDMECASVMAVGAYRNVSVYEFFYTEDSIGGDEWDQRIMGIQPQSYYEKYLRVALECAVRL